MTDAWRLLAQARAVIIINIDSTATRAARVLPGHALVIITTIITWTRTIKLHIMLHCTDLVNDWSTGGQTEEHYLYELPGCFVSVAWPPPPDHGS